MVADFRIGCINSAYTLQDQLGQNQPIWTDLRSLSAISAFQSQNKLGPLVAHFKIGCMNSAYTLQDQLRHISANWD